jgi:hypothetical protein
MLERIGSALGTRVSTIFALAEAEELPAQSVADDSDEGMALRRQYLTLNSNNRRMALELLRAMNKVQTS